VSPAPQQSSPGASSRGPARFISLFWRLLIRSAPADPSGASADVGPEARSGGAAHSDVATALLRRASTEPV
jgi:hypothetical protein